MKTQKSYIIMFLGTILTGMGIGMFLTPNNVVGGGASGLSTILFHTFALSPSITYFAFNVIFLLLGYKILGKAFVVKTLAVVSVLSVFVEIFSNFPIYTENLMLASIFGSALYGIGIGMNFASGASSGGTDILGRLIQHKFKSIPIGKVLLGVDGVIILTSLLIFKKIELTLYGIVALFISTYSIDFVINKLNISRLVFVITDQGETVSQKLITTSTRGVTAIDVTGVYSNTPKKMLFCALKESEVEEFQNKILSIDPNAFIVFSESQKIKGNGFYLYR